MAHVFGVCVGSRGDDLGVGDGVGVGVGIGDVLGIWSRCLEKVRLME
jgi:hypothetical protein